MSAAHDPPLPAFARSHVLLWSPRQQSFHIETVEEMLRANWGAFYYQEWHETDWVVLAFADTPNELHELRRSMETRFDDPAPGNPEDTPTDL